jgi:hypothetical protein
MYIVIMTNETRTATDTQATMWLVTKPTPNSELCDVLWECNWTDLGNAFKGGLNGSEVVGLYRSHARALAIATRLMDANDNTDVRQS